MSSDENEKLSKQNVDDQISPTKDIDDSEQKIDDIYLTGAEGTSADYPGTDDFDVDAEVHEALSRMEDMTIDEVMDRNIDEFLAKVENELMECMYARFDKWAEDIFSETKRKRLELEAKIEADEKEFEQDLEKLKEKLLATLSQDKFDSSSKSKHVPSNQTQKHSTESS